jgi:hypothetical protein
MSKIVLSICLAFAFFVTSAVAQMTPSGSQGTQNSPSTAQPGTQPQQEPGMSTDQNATPTQSENKSEHKLKGCVQSQGGQYMLETKKGKDIALTGQDVSAHVGHEVSLKGTWENGGSSSASASSSGSMASSGKTFNVTSVNMISDTCKTKGSNSGTMNNPSSSPNNSGSGAQPPQ